MTKSYTQTKAKIVDKTLATAKILNFLKENSDKKFSNRAIAAALNLSNSTVSSITGRLSALGEIKLPAIRKSKSVIAPLFQHADSTKIDIEVEREKDDVAVAVQNLLDTNKTKEFTKMDIVNNLSYSEGSISNALHALLITERIKITSITGLVKFQSSKGRKKAVNISFDVDDKDRLTISEYVKEKKLDKKAEDILRKEMSKSDFSLIYSSNGFRRTYLISELDKVKKSKLSKKTKKSLNRLLFDLSTGEWIKK